MSRSPSRKSVWNSQYHAPACRRSLKITLGLRRSSISVTWSLTKASCSLKRVSTQSAKSPVWWDLPPFTIFQGNSSSSSVSLRQIMQRRFTISSICKAYGYHNTHRYVHRFLLEIWNELVYEGRNTHIQTMIHKRQLKTRRFLVLSGFYVLMYMNSDEKANYSSERTGKCILYAESLWQR